MLYNKECKLQVGDLVTLETTIYKGHYSGWEQNPIVLEKKREIVPIINVLCEQILTVESNGKKIELNYDGLSLVGIIDTTEVGSKQILSDMRTIKYELFPSAQIALNI